MTVITDAGLALLVKLQPKLRRLDLGWTYSLTHEGFAYLKKLTHLEELKMHAPKLDDRGAAFIAQLPLRTLSMRHTAITDAAIEQIASMKRLEHLDVFGARKVTDKGVARLAELRNLKTLNVGWARGVTDGTLRALAGLQLKALDLSSFGCAKNPASAKFTDEGLAALAAMPSLRRVVISGASLVTEKGVNTLRAGTPKRDVVRGRSD